MRIKYMARRYGLVVLEWWHAEAVAVEGDKVRIKTVLGDKLVDRDLAVHVGGEMDGKPV